MSLSNMIWYFLFFTYPHSVNVCPPSAGSVLGIPTLCLFLLVFIFLDKIINYSQFVSHSISRPICCKKNAPKDFTEAQRIWYTKVFSSGKFLSLATNQPVAAVSGTHFKGPICRRWKAVLTSWQLCAPVLWTPHWGPKLINIQQIQTRHTVSRSIAPFQSIVSYNNRVTKKCNTILQNYSGKFPRVQHLWRQALSKSWKRAAVNFTCLWIPSSSEDSQELKEALLPNSERRGVGWDSAACAPSPLTFPSL